MNLYLRKTTGVWQILKLILVECTEMDSASCGVGYTILFNTNFAFDNTTEQHVLNMTVRLLLRVNHCPTVVYWRPTQTVLLCSGFKYFVCKFVMLSFIYICFVIFPFFAIHLL